MYEYIRHVKAGGVNQNLMLEIDRDEYIKHVVTGVINQNLMLKIDGDEWMEMLEMNISSMLEKQG